MPVPALAALGGIGAAFDIGSSLYGIFQGISDRRKGRRMFEDSFNNRPTYDIAPEARQMMGMRQATLNATPGAFRDLENDIFANQAATTYNARQAAPGSAALLGSIGTAQAETNRALRQAAMQEDAAYQQRLSGLEGAQRTMIGERQKAFDVNEMQPFEQRSALGLEMMGMGGANIYGGLRSLGSTFGNLYSAEADNKVVSTLMGMFMNNKRAPQMGGANFK
jgi:hypothetical protein